MDAHAGEDLRGYDDGHAADDAGGDEAQSRLDGGLALVFLEAEKGVLATVFFLNGPGCGRAHKYVAKTR